MIIFLFPDQLMYLASGSYHLFALIGFSNTEQESKAANQSNLLPILHIVTSIT